MYKCPQPHVPSAELESETELSKAYARLLAERPHYWDEIESEQLAGQVDPPA